MREIAPGLYTFTGLISGRVYLIEDADGLTLVDAGLERVAVKIIQQIEAGGYRADEVRRILVTHAHPDHVGGLLALKEWTGAQVITSAPERPIVEGRVPIPLPPPESLPLLARLTRPEETTLKGTPVDREVADGEVLDEVMGGLQVVATPGHTPGHLAYWQPERGILFCGDAIMRLGWLRLPMTGATINMDEARRSVQRLADLEPKLVCFGHGLPLKENAAQLLRRFARRVSR